MYTALPDAGALANAGLRPEDYACEAVEVWPENQRAFFLFSELQTQWIMGPMGPVGLNYVPLFHKMDRMRLDPDEYEILESDVRTMEHEALAVMAERE